MVERGLFFVLGASLLGGGVVTAGACGETFQSSPGAGGQEVQSCTTTADCDTPADPCTEVSCQNNTCLYTQGADNVPLPEDDQVVGDCRITVCINGASVDKPDEGDEPASDDCKSFTCNDGVAVQSNELAGESCGEGAALECDGMGNCVGCSSTAECPTSEDLCKPFACEMETCLQTAMTNVDLPDDEPGDCKRPACNADGNQVVNDDDSDVAPDPDPDDCVVPACIAGVKVEEAATGSCESGAGVCCETVCCEGSCVEGVCEDGGGGAGGAGAGGAGVGGVGVGGVGVGGVQSM